MEFKRWRGLPLQMFAITALPLIVLLVGLAIGGLTLHQRAMRTLVGERDERAARAAAAAINEQLSHRGAAVHGLALRAAADSPQNTLADATFLLPDFDGGIAFFSRDGRLQAATSENDFWQSDEVTESLAQIEPGTGPQWLPVFSRTLSGQPLMLVASTAPSGIMAVGAFSPEGMIRRILLDVFGASEQATTFVLDAQGRLLSQTGKQSQLGPDLSQHPGALGGLRGESGTNYLTTEAGELVIAFSPVVLTNWALVIEEPWQTVADPLLRVTEMAPFLMVPLLLITIIGLWFGVRQVVQPLQQLEQKATELAWGDFAAIEEPVGGILEVQRLQAELVHLAQKVQSAQQSMRGYLGAITAGQEEERRRLARELHDDTIQSLIALNQRLQLAQMAGSVRSAEEVDALADMQQMISQIIADLRRLTRDLRPIYLEDLGLLPALDMLAKDTHQLADVPVEFTTSGSPNRLRPEVELALYRMAQEALSNVVRHAQAHQVTMRLDFLNPGVKLTVSDDGQGFMVPDSPAEMAPQGHFGLLGLHERAELIGGQLTVYSEPSAGTRLVVVLDET